jgi:LiaF transmembrane domain
VNLMHVNRGLLGWGVFFIVAGAVPLAVQSGAIDPAVVRNVWQLWPLILIGIGLGLILQRTKAAVVGGLVVSITFGLLVGGWFAVGFAPGIGFGACGVAGDSHGDAFPTQSGTFDAAANVALDLSCGDMTVTSAAGSGWTVAGTSDGAAPPRITTLGGLKVESPHQEGLNVARAADWQVMLPTGVPVSLGLTGNAGTIRADLGAMQLPDLHASVNAGSATIDMGEVSGLALIDISANAGSLSLTLPAPAATLSGSISANAGSVKVCVPDTVGLRIRSSSSPLGSNNFGDRGLTNNASVWTRPGFDASTSRIDLEVSANLGSVTLNPEGGCG